jgi:hypothetical protein
MKPGASHAPSARIGWRPLSAMMAVLVVLGGACGIDHKGVAGGDLTPGPAPERDARGSNPDPDPDPDPDPGKPDAGPTDARVPPAPDMMSLPVDMKPDLPSNPNCAFGRHEARRATPEVLLLYDRSAGMRKTVAGTMQTRWDEMLGPVDDAVKRTETGMLWGLKLFPTTTMCEVADGVDVQVGMLNYSAVITKMRGSPPVVGPEGSPLHAAIRKAHFALSQRATPNPKFLVLASDGNVSCLPGPPAEMEAVRNVENAATQSGIRTFVLGTATVGSHQHTLLDQLATAGKEPISGATKYYPVQNKAEMLAALDRITQQLTSCVWTVAAQAPAPDFVAMEVDGVRVPRDLNQREGWNWAMGGNRQVIHVYGQACERLRARPTASVDMIYGCPGIAP